MSRLRSTAFGVIVVLTLPLIVTAVPAATAAMSGADVLAQSRAKYAAMKSYADTGVVTTEFALSRAAPPTVERNSFRTVYSAPRRFLLDFKKGAGGERLVIWGDGENFHTWWSATGVHEVYPRGQGANAFALSSLPTLGAAMAVPPLLFSQAGLHGVLTDFELVRSEGVETLDGRSCYRLVGTVGLAYGTGAVSGGRSTTIWIDVDTLLVGKMLEDTPAGSGADMVDRVITRFQPQNNPPVDPAVFQFIIPAG
jgi:hypothetical protein